MSIEEKAKAYDEAFSKAKRLYEGKDKTPKEPILEYLFPQLRESEDERIRKDLIHDIQMLPNLGVLTHRPVSEYIAYLEKQKEQKHYWKPTETDVALFNKAVTTNNTLTPAERAQLDIIRSKFGYCRAVNCSGIVQEEQKPRLIGEDSVEKMARQMHENGQTIEEQKPQWTEEDERMLSRCIKSIETSKQFADSGAFKEAKNKEISWLKDLLNRFNLQPKQEWSDEDERIRQGLIEMYKNEHLVSVPIGVHSKDIIRFLENLRPSWKPSDEQMNVLRKYVSGEWKGLTFNEDEHLKSLYNDLKKLKED